jgi:signal peptidase I
MNTTSTASTKRAKTSKYVLRALSALFVISLVAAPSVLQKYYGYGISPILSGSMRPYAQPGDAFITVKRPASELKVGDIVTLHSEASLVLYAHRIIEIRPFNGQMRIVTKGDANPTPEADPYLVSTTAQVPVTLFSVPKIGHVLVYMTSLQGRQAALILIIVANVLALLLAMFKKKVKERNLRAEQIYRELYDESSKADAHEVKKMKMYKELYTESQRELQTMKEK